MLQRATYQAVRAFHTAQSYLAASKPLEAAALFARTAERAQQAEAAWDDLERPDADALRQLAALTEQAQVGSPVSDAGSHCTALLGQLGLPAGGGLSLQAGVAFCSYLVAVYICQ